MNEARNIQQKSAIRPTFRLYNSKANELRGWLLQKAFSARRRALPEKLLPRKIIIPEDVQRGYLWGCGDGWLVHGDQVFVDGGFRWWDIGLWEGGFCYSAP